MYVIDLALSGRCTRLCTPVTVPLAVIALVLLADALVLVGNVRAVAVPVHVLVVVLPAWFVYNCAHCPQVQELNNSLRSHQQQLAAAEAGRRSDAATASASLSQLQQQLAEGEAGLLRRMTGAASSRCLTAAVLPPVL